MTNNIPLRIKLSIVCFLNFAVWGAYLISMGNYLGNAGMGDLIPWFFAIQGLVCLFMPALMGFIGDKFIEPQRLLGYCQLVAGIFMLLCWNMGMQEAKPDRTLFVLFYTISIAAFMPTIALSNSVAFRLLRSNGLDTVSYFPKIRVFGTIGFIVAMIFVNFAYLVDGNFGFSIKGIDRFQFNQWQFFVSGSLSLLLFIFTFYLPRIPKNASSKSDNLLQRLGFGAFAIFKSHKIAVFFFFSILVGMCLKVTNAYAAPFITSFLHEPQYSAGFGASNANLLTSLSQCSEALCILLVPFFIRRYGVKTVFAIAMFAWSLRFGSFAIGNPGDGLWLLIFSMIVYGVAFDFFNIAGAIFIEQETDKSITASAQGLWMMATMGIGASTGSLIAGWVINKYCHWIPSTDHPGISYLIGDWSLAWTIFALFAFLTGIAFCLVFKDKD